MRQQTINFAREPIEVSDASIRFLITTFYFVERNNNWKVQLLENKYCFMAMHSRIVKLL